jgi:hypothetical protein
MGFLKREVAPGVRTGRVLHLTVAASWEDRIPLTVGVSRIIRDGTLRNTAERS